MSIIRDYDVKGNEFGIDTCRELTQGKINVFLHMQGDTMCKFDLRNNKLMYNNDTAKIKYVISKMYNYGKEEILVHRYRTDRNFEAGGVDIGNDFIYSAVNYGIILITGNMRRSSFIPDSENKKLIEYLIAAIEEDKAFTYYSEIPPPPVSLKEDTIN
jgi:hypothetical protein